MIFSKQGDGYRNSGVHSAVGLRAMFEKMAKEAQEVHHYTNGRGWRRKSVAHSAEDVGAQWTYYTLFKLGSIGIHSSIASIGSGESLPSPPPSWVILSQAALHLMGIQYLVAFTQQRDKKAEFSILERDMMATFAEMWKPGTTESPIVRLVQFPVRRLTTKEKSKAKAARNHEKNLKQRAQWLARQEAKKGGE